MSQLSNDFDNLTPVTKGLVLALLLGFFVAGYAVLVHMPMAEELDSLDQNREQLLADRRTALAQRRKYLRLEAQVANAQAQYEKDQRCLPEDADIAAFLRDINRTAEGSGLKIRLVEPRAPQPGAQFVRIPVTVALRGSFHDVWRFVWAVGRLERCVNVEQLRMVEPKTTDSGTQLSVELVATTFRKPTPEEEAEALRKVNGT